ncbi:Hpt domain-containing protein [Luteimonas sp. RIT-PG2_3]
MTALRDAIDYTALGWVKPELDETLRQARIELEGFVDDPGDTSRMRFCAGYLHQVQGTLRMVELYAPAMVAEELELLAKALQYDKVYDREAACASLLRGVFQLPDYLERLHSGHKDIPIVLLPLLNELRAARGETGLSESMLFSPDLERPLPSSALPSVDGAAAIPAASDAQPDQALQSLLASVHAQVSTWSESDGPADAGVLADALDALMAHVQAVPTRRMLWVGAQVARAIGAGAVPVTAELQTIFASVEREARRIFEDDGFGLPRAESALEPTRQLLYHVAHSDAAHPALTELRRTFDLSDVLPTASEIDHARGSLSGRNRALLDTVSAAVKEDLLRVKDALDLHLRTGADDTEVLVPQIESLGRVADTLGMLGLGVARGVVQQQRDAMQAIVNGHKPADENALLDVAGALLYVDATLDDQVERLVDSDEDSDSQNLAAAETQRIVEVIVREAIANFADARHALVAFVETSWKHDELVQVPRLLQEVSGALTMLELPVAADYLTAVRLYTERELLARRRVPNGRQLDTFADALASLEYYLEALREQRGNRNDILDITRQSLETLGYWPLPEADVAMAPAPSAASSVNDTPVVSTGQGGERNAAAIADAGDAVAPTTTPEAGEGVAAGAGSAEASHPGQTDDRQASADPLPATPAAAVPARGGFAETGDEIDDEIREVFLEEFAEEIDNLDRLLPPWRAEPDNMERLLPIRRVFHTLKGSGRLVGADVLGEFSWKIEAMLNQVRDGKRPASPAVVAMVDQAFYTLPELQSALRGEAAITVDLDTMQASAERIAAGDEGMPVEPVRAAQAAMDAVQAAGAAVVAADMAAAAVVAAEAAALASPAAELIPARVDAMLLEILDAEVTGHLQTVDAWLAGAREGSAAGSDGLLRALHTMNGAFAMTEVPVINSVLGPAEAYARRLLASSGQASDEAVSALAALSTVVRDTLAILHEASPALAAQDPLAERLSALRDSLPEVSNSMPMDIDEDGSSPRMPDEPMLDDGMLDDGVFEGRVLEDSVFEGRVLDEGADERFDARADFARDPDSGLASGLDLDEDADQDDDDELDHSIALTDIDAASVLDGLLLDDLTLDLAEDLTEAPAKSSPDDSTTEPVADGVADAVAVPPEATPAEGLQQDALDEVVAVLDARAGSALVDFGDPAPGQDLADDLAEPAPDHHTVAQDASPAAASQDAREPDNDRIEIAQLELARLESERFEAGELEAGRLALQQFAEQQHAASQLEASQFEAGQREAARPASERVEAERLETERLETDRLEADRLEADRLEAERLAALREREFQDMLRMEEERLALVALAAAEEAAADDLSAVDATAQAVGEAGHAGSPGAPAASDADIVSANADAAADVVTAPTADGSIAAALPASPEDPDEPLDLTGLDPELVDIFVEEAFDLLDHADGMIAQLQQSPGEREPLIGLQRDLHTLKGGARMAGIFAIGELGHAMESLLEAVVEQRCELGRDGIPLLERGFDRLHAMTTRVAARQAVGASHALSQWFDARSRGVDADGQPFTQATQGQATQMQAETAPPPSSLQPAAAQASPQPQPQTPQPAQQARVELKPLSQPIDDSLSLDDDDISARTPQEQVRIRADLLDRLVTYAGEVAIYRARLEQQVGAFRSAMTEMEQTNTRLRDQLRRLDIETEAQIVARYQREQDTADPTFDPLELDRFSNLQQLSRALGESSTDLVSLQGTLDDLTRQYETLLLQQSRVSSDLQEGLMRTRMVPFETMVPRLRRVVRQASSETGKQVQLRLEGAQGELDRNVLERMTAPLEHMLRNAVAHGLEHPDERRRQDKPEEGAIRVAVRREGSEVVLEIADDGAGLDRDAIRLRAIERGLIRADATASEGELDALIFEPGFSTASEVSRLAGRGVGLDVVASEVRQLGGSLDIASRRGEGTTFTLRLPQTLAVTQAVFVRIGETQFAVPIASVRGVGRISRAQFEQADSSFNYGGEDYVLHDLGHLVGQAGVKADGQLQMPLLLIRAGELRAAVAVDSIVGNREIVVKPAGPQLASVPGIFGATIMGDGGVVVILDVAPLVRRQILQPRDIAPVAEVEVAPQRVPLVMVVDDSVTMRKVTGRVLERHQFEVVTAKDGVDALERMAERVPDLVLLDIEMPRMDGYELAIEMKGEPLLRDVPIMMITSRTGEKHRQRAFEIGVERYLGKPYQENELLRNVFEMLGMGRGDE